MVSTIEIHDRLLAIATTLSSRLTDTIEKNGPIELPPRPIIPFAERLCKAVNGQMISVRAAEAIWRRVVAKAEAEAPGKPLIDYVAQVDPAVLKSCGLSRAKVKTLGVIATVAQSGRLDAEYLGRLSPEERSAILTDIWGIGQWTADMMSIFYFGEADIWPDGDLAVRKTLTLLTSPRRKTVLTAEHFAPYRSYLALHMWRYVNAKPD